MTRIHDIYHYRCQKYQRRFKQLIHYAQLPFDVLALQYYKADLDNNIIEIPIIFHPNLLHYANCPQADQYLLNGYDNLLQLPPIMDHEYISKLESQHYHYSYLESISQTQLYKLPVMLKYHADDSISWLGVFVDVQAYTLAKYYELDPLLIELHNMIEDTYDSLVNTQEFSYRSSHQGPQLVPTDQAQATTRKLSSFTKTENLCFTAIYNGKYEAKEIAEYICRSHRTVEGLMSSMIAKLEVKNRYELFVEISKSHLHMRYLLNNSASQKERSQNHSQEKCSLV